MNGFCCPVCKSAFNDNGSSFVCQKGHCFDKAKSGYINLLIAQGKKGHGDDKLMVNARKCFLSKGYYLPLLEKIRLTVEKYAFNGCTMLDSGCGEGWYTCGIQEYLDAKRKEIIDAAYRVSLCKTMCTITMQDVINESGLSQGGIYR